MLDRGGERYRVDGEPFIPFEFADAAYRYGHSQIRHRYRINDRQPDLPLFPDLIGFAPVGPEMAVDWSLLFDVPGRPAAQRAKRIDGRLPASLISLPQAISGDVDDDAYRSLAARDLQRGQATGLPSGEAVARELGVEPLSPAECGLGEHGWDGETPLWFYILREASVRHDGDRLGDVGGRIVGEVLVGIIDADPERLSRRPAGLAADVAERRARALQAHRPAAGAGARTRRERPTGALRDGTRRRGMGGRPQRSPLNGGRVASPRRPAGSVRGRRFDRPPGGDAARTAAAGGRSGAPGALGRLGVRASRS